MRRRKFIATLSTGTVIAVAGCGTPDDDNGAGGDGDENGDGDGAGGDGDENGDGDGAGGDGDGTTEPGVAAVESYYMGFNGLSSDASTEEIEAVLQENLHGVSPLLGLADEFNTDSLDQTVDGIEAEVVDEDVDPEEFEGFEFNQEDYDRIEENAIVEGTVHFEDAPEQPFEHFTAVDGDEWKVVI